MEGAVHVRYAGAKRCGNSGVGQGREGRDNVGYSKEG